ncbi:Structural maintenance of chromosomes protein 5, partial [Termitomyces sp. T112]
CNKKDEKYNTALAEFDKVDEEFRAIKGRSKAALEESREVVQNVEEDLREQYNEIEAKRTQYDRDLTAAEANGTTPPSADGVDVRTVDELQAELNRQQAKLELNLNTNPGVVEQYEKRKRDIEVLEKTIETKQKSAEKIERSIKAARDNWQPGLEKLVASIGEKFSASFDR